MGVGEGVGGASLLAARLQTHARTRADLAPWELGVRSPTGAVAVLNVLVVEGWGRDKTPEDCEGKIYRKTCSVLLLDCPPAVTDTTLGTSFNEIPFSFQCRGNTWQEQQVWKVHVINYV